ncbi:MAG: hypothetical protein LBP28_04530 [Coriobacteriales bacterium]|jgi:hypothetical protein|nr:hypothetical protein [Coriobacteriales bacterium]
MATSSIGQIVVLDDDMADRMIESMQTANDRPFGQPTGMFEVASDDDVKRWIAALERKKKQ